MMDFKYLINLIKLRDKLWNYKWVLKDNVTDVENQDIWKESVLNLIEVQGVISNVTIARDLVTLPETAMKKERKEHSRVATIRELNAIIVKNKVILQEIVKTRNKKDHRERKENVTIARKLVIWQEIVMNKENNEW